MTSIHLVLKKRKKRLKLFHADSNFIKAHMLNELSGNKFISSVHRKKKSKIHCMYSIHVRQIRVVKYFLNTVYIYIVRLGCDCFI